MLDEMEGSIFAGNGRSRQGRRVGAGLRLARREALVCIKGRMRSFVRERFPVQGTARMPAASLSRFNRFDSFWSLSFSCRAGFLPRTVPRSLRGGGRRRSPGRAVPGSVRSPPGQEAQLPARFVSQVGAICAARLVCRTKGFGGDEGLWL